MAVFANKFMVELTDVARIVFVDERAPAGQGLPMATSTAAEVVMTVTNLEILRGLIDKTLKKHMKPDG